MARNWSAKVSRRSRRVAAGLFLTCAATPAQTWFSVPPRFEPTPGNSGVSMPGRWAQGIMQVLLQPQQLPSNLAATPLLAVRLRRPAFAEEPAWPARTVTVAVHLGDTTRNADQASGRMPDNRPTPLTTVFPQATVNMPASAALGPRDAVGAVMLDLPFAAPWTFAGPNLFIEFETFAGSQDVSAYHWVDAVDVTGGDTGTTVPLGAFGCGSRTARPMVLEPTNFGSAMQLGSAYPLLLRNTVPSAPGFVALRFDPVRNAPLGLPMGSDLATLGMPGCVLWAASDAFVEGAFFAVADANGNLRASVTLPDLPSLRGAQLGAQAFALDQGFNTLGVTSSNGLLIRPNFVGVFTQASTVLTHRPQEPFSPWRPFFGYTPVLLFRR